MNSYVLTVLMIAQVLAAETGEEDYINEAIKFVDTCGDKDLTLCFKEWVLDYLINLPNYMEIGGGLSLKANENETNRSPRYNEVPILPAEIHSREAVVDSILVERLFNYFTSRTLEFKIPQTTIDNFRRSLEEGRKKKKKSNILPLLVLIKLTIAALAAVALNTFAVLSIKALIISKVAFAILLLIGLRKIVETKHSSTYEVVAHDDHHGHYRALPAEYLAHGSYEQDF